MSAEEVASSDTYNGAYSEKYSWSQSIKDVDVKIPVGPEIKKGKDVIVDIQPNRLKVAFASDKDSHIVDGILTNPIVKDDSYWNLQPGEAIYIWLQKAKEKWWTALLENEQPIDPKSIEAVRPMDDLPEDEQMKIQELMWNQEQKLKGLPTSDELKMQEILKKAWDVEGSPFKGTPFDPTKVQLATDAFGGGVPPPNS